MEWFWQLRKLGPGAAGKACFSCALSFKPLEDQLCLPLLGAGPAFSEGVVATAFEDDNRPHADASHGVLWVLQRHPSPQETPTWGPFRPLLLQHSPVPVSCWGFQVEVLPSPPL